MYTNSVSIYLDDEGVEQLNYLMKVCDCDNKSQIFRDALDYFYDVVFEGEEDKKWFDEYNKNYAAAVKKYKEKHGIKDPNIITLQGDV